MPKVIYVQPDGTRRVVDAAAGTRVMRIAVDAGVDGIVGECGGQAMCATCHVYVEEPWVHRFPPVGVEEDEMLDETASLRTPESRLSCQLAVTDDLDGLTVRLPAAQL